MYEKGSGNQEIVQECTKALDAPCLLARNPLTIGANMNEIAVIRRVVKKRGMLMRLAEQSGVSHSTISRIVREETKNARYNTISALLKTARKLQSKETHKAA